MENSQAKFTAKSRAQRGGDRVKILGLARAGGVDAGVDVGGFSEGGVAGMFGSVALVPP